MRRLSKEKVEREIIALDVLGTKALQQRWREVYLSELDPIYCDRILRRWELFAKDDAELIACGEARSPEFSPTFTGKAA